MNDSTEHGMRWFERSFDIGPMPPLPVTSDGCASTSPINGSEASCSDNQTIFDMEKIKRKREAARVRQQRCRHRKKAEDRARVPTAAISAQRPFTTEYYSPKNHFTSMSNAEIMTMPPLVPLVVVSQHVADLKDTPDLTSEEKLGRKREAARIRQQRYRARKKCNGVQNQFGVSAARAAIIMHNNQTPVAATPSTLDRFNLHGSKESSIYLPGSIGSSSGVPSFLAMLGDADALASHIDGDAYIDQIVADV